MCSAGECWLIGLSVARLGELCHWSLGEVVAGDGPFVVLVGEDRADETDRGLVVGEDPDRNLSRVSCRFLGSFLCLDVRVVDPGFGGWGGCFGWSVAEPVGVGLIGGVEDLLSCGDGVARGAVVDVDGV